MNKSNSSCHPSIRPHHQQNIRKKYYFQGRVLTLGNLPRMDGKITHLRKNIIQTFYYSINPRSIKKVFTQKTLQNLYNVRQVKMIELLVSSSKPQRELEKEESLGQSIVKLIGGAGKGTLCFLFTISTLAKSPRKLCM